MVVLTSTATVVECLQSWGFEVAFGFHTTEFLDSDVYTDIFPSRPMRALRFDADAVDSGHTDF